MSRRTSHFLFSLCIYSGLLSGMQNKGQAAYTLLFSNGAIATYSADKVAPFKLFENMFDDVDFSDPRMTEEKKQKTIKKMSKPIPLPFAQTLFNNLLFCIHQIQNAAPLKEPRKRSARTQYRFAERRLTMLHNALFLQLKKALMQALCMRTAHAMVYEDHTIIPDAQRYRAYRTLYNTAPRNLRALIMQAAQRALPASYECYHQCTFEKQPFLGESLENIFNPYAPFALIRYADSVLLHETTGEKRLLKQVAIPQACAFEFNPHPPYQAAILSRAHPNSLYLIDMACCESGFDDKPLVFTKSGTPIACFRFSPYEPSLLVVGSEGGGISIYDTASSTIERINGLDYGYDSARTEDTTRKGLNVEAMAFHPNSHQPIALATVHRDERIRLWSGNRRTCSWETAAADHVLYNHAGTLLITAAKSGNCKGTITCIDSTTGTCIGTYHLNKYIKNIRLHPKKDVLAISCQYYNKLSVQTVDISNYKANQSLVATLADDREYKREAERIDYIQAQNGDFHLVVGNGSLLKADFPLTDIAPSQLPIIGDLLRNGYTRKRRKDRRYTLNSTIHQALKTIFNQSCTILQDQRS